jgi:ribonucleoside-diphosphate reductase alpha chain
MAQTNVQGGISRLFTKPGTKAYDKLKWVKRDSVIMNPSTGVAVFEQKDVEFTPQWSVNAINIVSQKYFAGTPGAKDRESSIRQLIDRVADTVTRQGVQEGYFLSDDEAENFREELKYICATQRAAFNSPVWFNIGWHDRAQQASACFILGVEDTMESILNWYTEEGMIFKGGSGSGINLSVIRSSAEKLASSGGTASGPVSFMRGADASAGTIKSGGKTRRAAKMVILNADHPDIEEFIWCKAIEERKSRVLRDAGFDMSLDGRDSFSVQYQNANNSVRVTDEFMQAVVDDGSWDLRAVKDGRVIKTVKARELYRQFAEAAWECADPGMQFDTVINKWHTSPNAGRINGSNPCSEYMHLDNSACNLSSINLLQYLNEDATFDVEAFKHTVQIMFTAQEILVGYSAYPTESITKNAKAYRELGLGYANLGAMLMAQGLPYDSDAGRAQAGAITALMTGHAYATSAKIANRVGPFAGYHKDKEAMINVLKMHRAEVSKIDAGSVAEDLLSAAAEAWDEAVELGEKYGVRNSQATVLAPTGTIGLMMDCDTTGIEPDLGLTKVKKLVGGGTMFIVNQTVPRALKALGYTAEQSKDIVAYIDTEKTILGAPHLKKDHYPVFACSMGDNAIHYMGHVKMMAAAQPFLSGAISKTVNMPETATVEDIEQLHIEAWTMGLKAIAIYRDNCKVAQPLSMAKKAVAEEPKSESTSTVAPDNFIVRGAVKRELPKRRSSKTYEFRLADLKGFFTVGEYEDGTPGELFITISKQGSTLSGLMDSFARSVSHGLKYGVPLKSYVKSLMGTSFAPAGITDDKDIRTASSITDYIFRRLAMDYLSFDDRLELGLASLDDMVTEQVTLPVDVALSAPVSVASNEVESVSAQTPGTAKNEPFTDPNAPLCFSCGNRTQRSGSCYVCQVCGSTSGCS